MDRAVGVWTTLSAAFSANRVWTAGLFVAGLVAIFAGFLARMARLNLGAPAQDMARGRECPWKLTAMLLVAAPIILLGLLLPGPVYALVDQAAQIMRGVR